MLKSVLQKRYREGLIDHTTSGKLIPIDFDTKTDYLPSPRLDNDNVRSRSLRYHTINQKFQSQLDNIISLSKSLFPQFSNCEINFLDNEIQINYGPNSKILTMNKNESFCGHTITNKKHSLFVKDVYKDWRFKNNPCVKTLNLGSYFGKAFQVEDQNHKQHAVGSLCFSDSEAKDDISETQKKQMDYLIEIIELCLKQWLLEKKNNVKQQMNQTIQLIDKTLFEKMSHRDFEIFNNDAYSELEHDIIQKIKKIYDNRFDDQSDNITLFFIEWNSLSQWSIENNVKLQTQCKQCNIIFDTEKTTFLVASGYMNLQSNEDQTYSMEMTDDSFTQNRVLICQGLFDRIVFDQDDLDFATSLVNCLNFYRQCLLVCKMNRQKTKFISGFSHCLRTPLHGLLGTIELMKLEYELEDVNSKTANAEVSSFSETTNATGTTSLSHGMSFQIDIIEKCGKTVENLVNNLIDFYQYDNPFLRVHAKWLNLYQFEEDLLNAYSFLIKNKVTILSFIDISSNTEEILIDGELLKQCVCNILDNAVNFTHDGFISLTLCVQDKTLKIEVIDTGNGIDEEFLKTKLFRSFSKENDHSNNMGLGLHGTQKIIKKLNGSIQVANNKTKLINEFSLQKHVSQNRQDSFQRGVTVNMTIPIDQSQNSNIYSSLKTICETWKFELKNFPDQIGSCLRCILSNTQSNTHTNSKNSVCCVYNDIDPALKLKDIHKLHTYSVVFAKPYTFPLLDDIDDEIITSNIAFCELPFCTTKLLKCFEKLENHKIKTAREDASNKKIENKNIKVLIVDDNAVNRNILAMFCKKLKMPYDLCVNGFECVDYIKNKFYDLVLLDFQMPGINGIETVNLIRQHEFSFTTKRSYIVMLTGISDNKIKKECYANGANDFYIKPMSLQSLKEVIKTVFT